VERLLLIASLCLAMPVPAARAAATPEECGQCQVKIEAKKKLKDSEAEYSDLLRRNKEYLSKIGPSDNSKLIKLNSNITLINIKIEGIQKNIAEIDGELAKDDCAQCVPAEKEPSPKPSDVPKDDQNKKVKSGT
jgi:hypothetical protein